MAEAGILFGKQTEIGVVTLDCSISERHSSEVEMTKFPVEMGADVTDNIRPMPAVVEIKGVVSNNPLTYLVAPSIEYNKYDRRNMVICPVTMRTNSPVFGEISSDPDRANLAYARLEQMMADGELVSVVTSLKEYSNMVLRQMDVERDVKSGNVLECTLRLEEMVIVQTALVAAPVPVKPSNKLPADKGKIPSKESTPQQDESALYSLTH